MSDRALRRGGETGMSSLDEYLRLLADERRRRLLRAVREGEPVSVAAVAEDDEAESRLYHVHLPKLARAGLIDWDPRDGVVVRGQSFDDVRPLLDATDDDRYRDVDGSGGDDRDGDDAENDDDRDGDADDGGGDDAENGDDRDADDRSGSTRGA
jgi:DNA-binding transcriptional ArsR family regulator